MTQTPNMAEVKVGQVDRDAAADALSDMGVDWGACGDVRHGRTSHPLVQAFARHAASPSPEQAAGKEAERFGTQEIATRAANAWTPDRNIKVSCSPNYIVIEGYHLIRVEKREVQVQRIADYRSTADWLNTLFDQVVKELDARAGRAALSEPLPSAPSEVSIPAGMKAWAGGDGAPDDFDEWHPVKFREGTCRLLLAREIQAAWSRSTKPAWFDIIAYTPIAPSDVSGDREAIARIVWNAMTEIMNPGSRKGDIANDAADRIIRTLSPAASVSAEVVERLREGLEAFDRYEAYSAMLLAALTPFSSAAEACDAKNADRTDGDEAQPWQYVSQSDFAGAFAAYSERLNPEDIHTIREAFQGLGN